MGFLLKHLRMCYGYRVHLFGSYLLFRESGHSVGSSNLGRAIIITYV